MKYLKENLTMQTTAQMKKAESYVLWRDFQSLNFQLMTLISTAAKTQWVPIIIQVKITTLKK